MAQPTLLDPRELLSAALQTRKPWANITEFATSPEYCGLRLYPRQLTILKLIYLETDEMNQYDIDTIESWRDDFLDPDRPTGVQPDVWERVAYLQENGYHHFPHVQAIIGRRGSKGMIGGIIAAERVASFFALDNWQQHFGIAPNKDAYINVVATSALQARKFQFADIREAIEGCAYLRPHIAFSRDTEIAIRTPADVRLAAEMKAAKVPIDHEIATLRVTANSSSSASSRGATAFMIAFDEFAHMLATESGRSSNEVYGSMMPSLDQFGVDAIAYVPSSPYSQTGRFYSLYQEGCIAMPGYEWEGSLESQKDEVGSDDRGDAEDTEEIIDANPEMLILKLPSWEPYVGYQHTKKMYGWEITRPIQEYNTRMKRLENSDPQKFWVERGAQFASVMNAYLDARKVEQMFAPFWGGRELTEQRSGSLRHPYTVHLDPSSTNANFAMCIAHVEMSPPDEEGESWPHVIVDYLKVWKPEDFPEHTLDYIVVQRDIIEIINRFIATESITSDQFNAAGILSALRQAFPKKRVYEETFTAPSNQRRMERFKTALNLGWVHSYRDDFFEQGGSLLEQEAKFLQRKANGRVDKQDVGPVTTKDLFDTLCTVTDRLLGKALDRWTSEQLGGTRMATGSSSTAYLRSPRGQEAEAGMRRTTPSEARSRLSSDSRDRIRGGGTDPARRAMRDRRK